MARNESGWSAWDVLRSVLAIVSVLLSGLVAYSARLVVERSDAADAELARRVANLEMQIGLGILPRSDERFQQIQRDIQRLERDIERLERVQPQ